ncbi:MAG: hypothetical protein H6855_00215 [Rhodospirillales bacterium]|nr:hypothetical protein [Rhodospirillales bacterium]
MMRLFFLVTIVCLISTAVKAKDFETLKQEVIKYAQTQPEQAYEHFMRKIEDGATVPEQALYLYGMGIAHEKLGKQQEALDDYLSAEILGYKPAKTAVEKLQDSKE